VPIELWAQIRTKELWVMKGYIQLQTTLGQNLELIIKALLENFNISFQKLADNDEKYSDGLNDNLG
jgi:hypothetical protein